MLCIDLSSSHRNSEYLDAFIGDVVLHGSRDLFHDASVQRGTLGEETDLWCFLSWCNRLFTLFDVVSHTLLPFTEDVEVFWQVGGNVNS